MISGGAEKAGAASAASATLTPEERAYAHALAAQKAWDEMPTMIRDAAVGQGCERPELPKMKRKASFDEDEHDPFERIAAPTKSEEPEPELRPMTMADAHKAVRAALHQLLCAITNSRHPICYLLAELLTPLLFSSPEDFEREITSLALVLAKTDTKSQAAAGRVLGVGRATVNKRSNRLRDEEIIKAIQSFAHGGKPSARKKAKVTAKKGHATRKEKNPCKTKKKDIWNS